MSFFVRRSLAGPETLTGHILAGDPEVGLPVLQNRQERARRDPGGARLGADAFGTSGAEAGDKLERVLGGEGYFVTTGHQPVLFLGPLYVLHKAVTAIELAAHLEALWAVPVLPLFWVASDDHDWPEVGSTQVLDAEHELVTLSVDAPAAFQNRSVGPSPVGPKVEDLIERIAELVAPSQFKGSVIASIRDAYRPEATLAGAFAELLRSVLGDRTYVWLDSSSPTVRTAATPFYQRMLEDPKPILAAEAAGAERLETAGFEPPIGALTDALPLFVDSEAGRVRLFVGPEGGRAGRDGVVEPLETWRARLENQPELFSPNVSSRPALESWLLPVTATVLGPGEMAYWSQLPPLFEALETPFPWIHPRGAWSIVEPNVRRPLERLGFELDALSDGGEEAINALTAASRPAEVDERLAELKSALAEPLDGLEMAVDEALPGLRGAAGKTRKYMLNAVQKFERQVDRQTRSRLDVEIGQVHRCAANLFPGRKPQERVLNPIPFLARHGSRLIDELAEETARWIADSLASPGEGG